MRSIFRYMSALLALVLCILSFSCAGAEKGDLPELNEAGFLDSGEFVYEDDKAGVWRYASDTLWIEIFRREQKKPARVWYEAEIRVAEGAAGPRMVCNDPENWKKTNEYPYKLCRKKRVVLAVSNDFAQLRIAQKKAKPGIIIRDGIVYSDKTKPKNSKGFPNQDCLAIWPDGDMQVFYSDEKTAEEYLEAGAVDVLSFGPILIRDGELNEEGLKKYGTSHAERVAVGMVEKGHYYFMMLEGRIKRSNGDTIRFLAEKLQEKGCVTAFNLDGGDSASIVFMGHQLCRMKDGKNWSSRTTADVLAIGYSELVAEIGDPW